MEFKEYVRKPFVVQAVEITVDNIHDIAKLVGEVETKDDGKVSIKVDRRLVPNVYRVWPGFFLTKMGDHVRCYARKIFLDQFAPNSVEIQTWVDFMNAGGMESSRTTQE